MRRHLLTAVTLLVLLALVGLGGYYGYRELFAPVGDDRTARSRGEKGCEAGLRKGETVRTRDVTVSVLNAGTRSGLAGQVQEELVGRGFIAGAADNAPDDQQVRFVRILAPSSKDPAARLVAAQFGPKTYIQATRDDLHPDVRLRGGRARLGKRRGGRTGPDGGLTAGAATGGQHEEEGQGGRPATHALIIPDRRVSCR